MSLVDAASAATAGRPQSATELVKQRQNRGDRLPNSVVNAIRRDISRNTNIPRGQLRAVDYSRQSWPNSCLGLAKAGEACAEIFIENGWRVIMSNGKRQWVYRSDNRGDIVRAESITNPNNSNLPNSVKTAVLQLASEHYRVPTSQIRIATAQQETWADGCLGLPSPVERCAGVLTPGWRVTVEVSGQQTNVYRTNNDGSQIRTDATADLPPRTDRLPNSVARAAIAAAQRELGVPPAQLYILQTEQQQWPNGCLGLARSGEGCTQAIVPGWRVTVNGNSQTLVYRTNKDGSAVMRENADDRLPSGETLPDSVRQAVLQKARSRSTLPNPDLQVVQSEQKQWTDGCLGLGGISELCLQAIVPGWRVTVTDGQQTQVYRTNNDGSTIRLEEADATPENSDVVPISDSELPPPLPRNTVFRAITTGGIAGQTVETRLLADGQVIQTLIVRNGSTVPPRISRISRQQVRQFQQLLRQQFSQFDRLSYPASTGADFFTITLTSQGGTTRYAETEINRLPQPLQEVIQSWNRITQG
jgi:hypothetical protein